jgi:DNA-directed RNA polymerase subunit alpha
MPRALVVDESTATRTYARFVAEPMEKGFGHTIGNSLRRVLLSSMEGVAVSSVRIDGVKHEFSNIPDVVEDVTEIVLNIKQVKLECSGDLPRTLELRADKAGAVTADSIQEDGVTQVLNPDLVICTLDCDSPLRMELEIDRGRGWRPGEENKREDHAIGVIPVDSLFSPVERVRYDVQSCRVGQRTDYDRLELEVWTDGRIDPREALRRASLILSEHLAVFSEGTGAPEEQYPMPRRVVKKEERTAEDEVLLQNLTRSVAELELSVRAENCLNNAEIRCLGQLAQKSEPEMLKFRNFGRKSLEEIRNRLEGFGLSFGMDLSEDILADMERIIAERDAE